MRQTYLRSHVRDVLPNELKVTARRHWVRLARRVGYPISSQRLPRPRLSRGRRELRLRHVLLACDLNPVYLDFWPLVSEAWAEIVGIEAILVLVAPEERAPSQLLDDPRVRRFTPIDGMHTAFQAQCIRLLYPALLNNQGAVIISDMELMPLSREYFHGSLAGLDARFLVSYRDVLHSRGEIAIAYSAAEPATWRDLTGVRDEDDVRARLRDWYDGVEYEGVRGGGGWYADQQALFRLIALWPEAAARFWMLDDDYAGHRRLEREAVAAMDRIDPDLRADVMRGRYSDFNAVVPHSVFSATNENLVQLAIAARRRRP